VNVLLVTVVATTVATVLALVVLGLFVRRRAKVVVDDLTLLQQRVQPDLERLQRDADLTAREWARIAEAADRIGGRSPADPDHFAGPRVTDPGDPSPGPDPDVR
jgi:hypothetical protein